MHTASSPYDVLGRGSANHTPLSPLSFLPRAAAVYPELPAVRYGDRTTNWSQTYRRCARLAGGLRAWGIQRGDTVAILATNTPPMFEAHFGVPASGAVLNAINYRLDAAAVAFILDHARVRVLFVDGEFSAVARQALQIAEVSPRVVDLVDRADERHAQYERIGEVEYEDFLAASPGEVWQPPDDEWQAISLNYTSGTTGNPKGVVYHHRGAYLNALGNALTWNMGQHPTYLWTLPMFHCNGWCFPWTLAALAGTNVCQRKVSGADIYRAFAEEGVTHLCGAPIVMQILLAATDAERRSFPQQVHMLTAAAPPPAAVLARMAAAGIEVTHVYGLTETYGPAVVSAWKQEWNELPPREQAALKSRQGVASLPLEEVFVADPQTLDRVPADGETMGEVMFRGNIVMKGYLSNQEATEAAFAGGVFHSGDLGVCHADGYIELRDRSKDIIISGGENISSIEVEGVLYGHPAVAAVAVVAMPHERWGETPCAFVELEAGNELTEEDLLAFCREHLAGFKCPRRVVFADLPKTSTGKIKKFEVRERARNLAGQTG